MKFPHLSVLILFLGSASFGTAQTPTPTPALLYSSFAQAIAAAKQAREAKKYPEQENAYRQALEKAKTVDQKFDAMMGLALVVSERSRRLDKPLRRGSRTIYSWARSDEAFDIYQEILSLPALSPTKSTAARLARADMLRKAHFASYTPPELYTKAFAIAKKELPDLARDEYSALMKDPASSADTKIGAHTGFARTYYEFPSVLNVARDGSKVVESLVAAVKVVGGSDVLKAEALNDIIEIGQRANNLKLIADGYEAVLELKSAAPKQRLAAAQGLGRLLILNKQPAEARTIFQTEMRLPGISVEEKGMLHRMIAISYLYGIDPKDSAAMAAQSKLAKAELTKSLSYPKMTDDEKATILTLHGEFLGSESSSLTLGIEMFEAALSLKKANPKLIDRANYQLGEVLRQHKKFGEARLAYEKVGQADPQYYNYAQQRLKALPASPPSL